MTSLADEIRKIIDIPHQNSDAGKIKAALIAALKREEDTKTKRPLTHPPT